MAARAFVIAIEDYGAGNFLPPLPGCNRDADSFIRWLLEKKLKNVKPEQVSDFIRCCSGKDIAEGKDLEWRTAGTTSGEIISELAKCVKLWADRTEEFYFFYSGHGFSYSNSAWEKSVDVLVASDFTDLETGGRACLPLDEVRVKLWKSLGPRHHYYFIDACRNLIPAEQLSLSGTGLGFPTSQLGTPTVYRMFSTAQNKTSDTQSGFTPALVRGLRGGGRAKGLRSNQMFVIFDLLGEYMRKSMRASGQDVEYGRDGSGEGYILKIDPIENSACEISVEGASPEDEFTLTVRDIKGLDTEHKFKGGSFKVQLFPDEYFLELKHATGTVTRKEPPPPDAVDLYDPGRISFEFQPSSSAETHALTEADLDDYIPAPPETPARAQLEAAVKVLLERGVSLDAAVAELRRLYAEKSGEPVFAIPAEDVFQVRGRGTVASDSTRTYSFEERAATGGESTSSSQSLAAKLKLKAAPETEVQAENLKTGEVLKGVGGLESEAAPGEYVVRLIERGVTVSRRNVTLRAGEELALDLLARDEDKIRDTIIKAVGADTVEGASVFSEHALGPLANDDLALWLSLFGASRIVGMPGEFSKLVRLKLETFDDVKQGESVVYLLAGFEKSEAPFGVGLSSGPHVDWERPGEVEGLFKIYERRFEAERGAHLLSLKLPGQPPATFAVHCLPNRATLAAVAEDKEGRLTFHQFLLPLRHLFEHLGPTVQGYAERNMLGVVRTLALAQSQFARKRSVQKLLKETDADSWDDLVNHRWLDPLMALVAAYDIIRHGTIEQGKKLLGLMNSTLRKDFEGMGDVEALAKLIGAEWGVPASPPLLLDGVLAFDDVEEKQMLPLSPDRLDYKSTWTAWRGAVNDFDPSQEVLQ
ncbi:MAG TPA: caspase family protein [Pyrinomonadaceae bacterium]|nr:caspase family protein [Pyrinomonadaceae bacterium]